MAIRKNCYKDYYTLFGFTSYSFATGTAEQGGPGGPGPPIIFPVMTEWRLTITSVKVI